MISISCHFLRGFLLLLSCIQIVLCKYLFTLWNDFFSASTSLLGFLDEMIELQTIIFRSSLTLLTGVISCLLTGWRWLFLYIVFFMLFSAWLDLLTAFFLRKTGYHHIVCFYVTSLLHCHILIFRWAVIWFSCPMH